MEERISLSYPLVIVILPGTPAIAPEMKRVLLAQNVCSYRATQIDFSELTLTTATKIVTKIWLLVLGNGRVDPGPGSSSGFRTFGGKIEDEEEEDVEDAEDKMVVDDAPEKPEASHSKVVDGLQGEAPPSPHAKDAELDPKLKFLEQNHVGPPSSSAGGDAPHPIIAVESGIEGRGSEDPLVTLGHESL